MASKYKEPPPISTVFISYIKDICTFYVVNQTFLKIESDWFKVCELEAKRYKNRFKEIKIDDIYLIQYKLDNKYYRVSLQEINSNHCKVKFIDYGNDTDVLQDQLVKCPDLLKICKPRARECSFYNIKWCSNKEKNKALACVAGERRLFRMVTVAQEEDVSLVDLITLGQRRFSLRDFLLSYNIGMESKTYESRAVDRILEAMVIFLKNQSLELIANFQNANKIQESINKRSLKSNQWYDVKIREIYSPDEFYVCETKDLDAEAELQKQMKEFYAVLTPEMFVPIAVRSYYAIQLNDESWHRIEVLEKCNDNGSCTVLFIDIGMVQNEVSVSKLLVLDEKFHDFKRMAIKCSLANITPKNGDFWSKEAIKLMKYALEFMQENEAVRIRVEDISKIDRSAEVTVEIMKESIKIDLNMSLVYFNHAITENLQPPFNRHDDDKIMEVDLKPLPIIILSIDEAKPDEFYFAYKKFAGGIENIRDLIQVRMKTSKKVLKDWRKGDICMVYYREQLGKPKLYWYRGIIELINFSMRKCCLFLCDRGTLVVCSLSMLRECPAEFKDIPNSCHRGHLPCTPFNSTQWSRESIKKFRSFLQDFSKFSITILDNRDEVNSKCVTLWGQKLTELFQKHNGYYNIVKGLVSIGIAEAEELFQLNYEFSVDFTSEVEDESFEDEPALKLPDIEGGEVMVLEYKVKLMKRRITNWLPVNPSKKVFVGLPTYVDNNSEISINDKEEEYYLESIKNILNKYYNDKTQSIAHNFKVGEPCIARFPLDRFFYRGSIVAVFSSSYEVLFIDYGNTEKCNKSDIFNNVMCSEIPIMSYKFLLPSSNIRINAKLNDALHSFIVGKICNISASDDNDSFHGDDELVPNCRITVDNMIFNSFQDVINHLFK